MLLKDYLVNVHKTINDVSLTGVILSSDITTDIRTEKIGLLKGVIVFLDGSTLFFKEYLDLRYQIDKKMYSYHYQDIQARLRFRYDNAAHKPPLGFYDHKHTSTGTFQETIPELREVLEEIIITYLTES